MLPTTFPQQNCEFKKPADMTDEEYMSLPVWRGHYQDGTPCIISCWQLSKEDLEDIQRTGRVWVSIVGTGMPPVSVFTENPFNQQ